MDELFLSGCQIAFTGNAVQVFAPSELVAIALRRSQKELAQWAVQFRKEATEIFFPGDGGRPYKATNLRRDKMKKKVEEGLRIMFASISREQSQKESWRIHQDREGIKLFMRSASFSAP